MRRKDKKKEELDTETTFADMNIEGFRWYDASKKNGSQSGGKAPRRKISRREYWQMVRGAFAAYLPVFLIVICVFALMGCLAWVWLH